MTDITRSKHLFQHKYIWTRCLWHRHLVTSYVKHFIKIPKLVVQFWKKIGQLFLQLIHRSQYDLTEYWYPVHSTLCIFLLREYISSIFRHTESYALKKIKDFWKYINEKYVSDITCRDTVPSAAWHMFYKFLIFFISRSFRRKK